jgi:hypothetical protein
MIQTVGFTPTKSQPQARPLAERAGRSLSIDLRSLNNLRTVRELLALEEMTA